MHCNAIAFVNSVNINSVRGVSLSGSGNNFRVRVRDITTNSLPNIINGRPYSPKNHDGKIAVVWWRGPYAGWERCFNTNIWCAPVSNS